MSNKPLEGIRVVDLTQIYQGPYAAFLMAMSGAEVVKVEPRGGERLRGAGGCSNTDVVCHAQLQQEERHSGSEARQR